MMLRFDVVEQEGLREAMTVDQALIRPGEDFLPKRSPEEFTSAPGLIPVPETEETRQEIIADADTMSAQHQH